MSTVDFEDSRMQFSHPEDSAFRIEKSQTVSSLGQGIKSCEAVVFHNKKILFLEAKQSFSNPANAQPFQKNIEEVVDKFRCSMAIVTGLWAERPYSKRDTLPSQLTREIGGHLPFQCVLILRDHPDDKLYEVSDALNQSFSNPEKRLSCIDSVIVINGKRAKQLGLVKELVEV